MYVCKIFNGSLKLSNKSLSKTCKSKDLTTSTQYILYITQLNMTMNTNQLRKGAKLIIIYGNSGQYNLTRLFILLNGL